MQSLQCIGGHNTCNEQTKLCISVPQGHARPSSITSRPLDGRAPQFENADIEKSYQHCIMSIADKARIQSPQTFMLTTPRGILQRYYVTLDKQCSELESYMYAKRDLVSCAAIFNGTFWTKWRINAPKKLCSLPTDTL